MNLKALYVNLKTAGIDLDKIDLDGYPLINELLNTMWDCVHDDDEYNTEVTIQFDTDVVPQLIEEIITVVGLTQVRRDQIYHYEKQLYDMTVDEHNYKSKINYLEKFIKKQGEIFKDGKE